MKNFIARKKLVVCDIEVSPNAFLIGFKGIESGKVIQIGLYGENDRFTIEQRQKVRQTIIKYGIVTFNGVKYDMPVILKSLMGASCKEMFKMSKTIIEKNMPGWLAMKQFGVDNVPGIVHIDLSEPAPGVMISLKMYGARLHSQRLQDLPYEYDKHLTPEEYKVWCDYNINDLDTTIDLYHEIKDAINLRYSMSDKYQLDLMSKGDAQIAEAVMVQEISQKGVRIKKVSFKEGHTFKYLAPDCISFVREDLQQLLVDIKNEDFALDKGGKPKLPKWLSKPFQIGDTKYKFGLGGIHSQEKKLVFESCEKHVIRTADVGSYYPSEIIEYEYYPKNIGKIFLDIYTDFYWSRNDPVTGFKVKGMKTESDSTKLTLNGLFGKLGSKWSKVYAPELMIQVTLTGQLLLVMLIEQLELAGARVLSSNTDGIEYVCGRDQVTHIEALIYDWELETGMTMDHDEYKALYARDVNNYVAVYNGYTKSKGAYGDPTPKKNAEYYIVFDAIKKYLLDGTLMEDTINQCEDVRQFIICRNVTGGGIYQDEYLGKVVRWYYSEEGDKIVSKKNGNKVAKSDKAIPLMDLPFDNEIPRDLSKQHYIDLAIGHLKDLGVDYVS